MPKEKQEIPLEIKTEIVNLYCVHKIGVEKIAARVGTTRAIAKRILIESKVEIRTRTTNKFDLDFDRRSTMISLYESGMSLRDVGKKIRVGHERVRELLQDEGLKIRAPGSHGLRKVTMATCCPDKEAIGRGLCGACYIRWYREQNGRYYKMPETEIYRQNNKTYCPRCGIVMHLMQTKQLYKCFNCRFTKTPE